MDKILIIITKGEVGGAQMSVLGLARELSRRGQDVTVGFGEGDWLEHELAASHIPLIRFHSLKRTHNPVALLFTILEIKTFFDQNKFDIVHINSSNALAAGLAARLSLSKPKTVFTHRGLTLLDQNYKKNLFFKFAYRLYFKFFLRFIDRQVFVCQSNLDYALVQGIADANDSSVVYNGLNLDGIEYTDRDKIRVELAVIKPELKKYILNENVFLVGTIARLDYAKNFEFFIKIFPDILNIQPNTIALIMGKGNERAKYEKLISNKGIKDKFFLVGEIENAKKYIKIFDLFILPSRYEGLSLTLLEAQSAGIPILASDVGGTIEILLNSNDAITKEQIYKLDDEKDFLDKYKKMATDANLRERVSRANIERSRFFDIDTTVKNYLEIYKNIGSVQSREDRNEKK